MQLREDGPDSRETRGRHDKILIVVLVVVCVLGVAGSRLALKRFSEALSDVSEGLDSLRTDRTWRDTYREMAPVDADIFFASFGDLEDPMLHPRMKHGVVLRGRVHGVDTSSSDEPAVILRASPGEVRCRFDASRIERVKALEAGHEVVLGGALVGVADGIPQLMACHFADEWERREE